MSNVEKILKFQLHNLEIIKLILYIIPCLQACYDYFILRHLLNQVNILQFNKI